MVAGPLLGKGVVVMQLAARVKGTRQLDALDGHGGCRHLHHGDAPTRRRVRRAASAL